MVGEEGYRKAPVHVGPRSHGGWAVIREGNKKASAVHPPREQAEKHARSMASKDGSEVYVHQGQDEIREHSSYDMTVQTHEGARGEEGSERPADPARHRCRPAPSRPPRRREEKRHRAGGDLPDHRRELPWRQDGDPIGRVPAESDTYEELSREEVKGRYPELWEKMGSSR